jgi:hypothetical protein
MFGIVTEVQPQTLEQYPAPSTPCPLVAAKVAFSMMVLMLTASDISIGIILSSFVGME